MSQRMHYNIRKLKIYLAVSCIHAPRALSHNFAFHREYGILGMARKRFENLLYNLFFSFLLLLSKEVSVVEVGIAVQLHSIKAKPRWWKKFSSLHQSCCLGSDRTRSSSRLGSCARYLDIQICRYVHRYLLDIKCGLWCGAKT